MGQRPRILVIKLSALGDFVLSLGAFQAIRAHHPEAELVLLTSRPFEGLARASGLFDEVWLDAKPPLSNLPAVLALRRRLRGGRFARVYDLQRSDRTGWYFRLLWPDPPEWVGKVAGCSHRYTGMAESPKHIVEREAEQLAVAGIAGVPPIDLSFARADVSGLGLPERHALLVPGCSAHVPAKRWPPERYAALAKALAAGGTTPLLIGTAAERAEIEAIAAACPEAVSLLGRTSLEQLATLAGEAQLAVGNDTGPAHLIAAAGCPTLMLFSAASDPRAAPRGPRVASLRRDSLADLSLEEVLAALAGL
ncbi:ADP-heptose:LPS heptosyltransferase [Tistlia consotensis]|uniref:ADP-heptose:LPS heptosyltransferase n=1 Tax=Tistlia consotensis USBA 355 TaxID=560819 RepID=A0A1Y6B3C9_9PROT|nr:glycosyltransferase family 9 protein [Tistlia consotensis]SME89291.1 ADP-heptose:LPS heptosyltransferase [Tistlia consotensis USBA 355]SNR25845.1 ADP-heptose:LPS heptosyltransferase [Tistlia consotensis]